MDQKIEAVVLGVLANGITALISEALPKGKRKRNPSLNEILGKAAEKVAEEIDLNNPIEIEKTCLFLSSNEAAAIVRQLYSLNIADQLTLKERGNFEDLRNQFIVLFAAYTEVEREKIAGQANTVFYALLRGCSDALNNAINNGILSAHEANSSFRHHQILDELAAIQNNLEFLRSQAKVDIESIYEFEDTYCQQVANRHGKLIPPNLDTQRKVPIDAVYVAPSFYKACKIEERTPSVTSLQKLTSSVYRAVILGNPGGGKSTLTDKLCYDFAKRSGKRLFAGRRVTPIHIVLREYGARKVTPSGISILQYIEEVSNSKYQVYPPSGVFDYLLRSGHVLLIFDGLDELLDTSHRREIAADVESFCNLYPSVPVIVTSREVGYDHTPLDEISFEVFRLASFDDDQIEEYVTKWFAIDKDLPSQQQKQKTNAFLRESQIVPDLRSNPLMLALMCNIYRGETYIPQNRPDLYEKCAKMLFERWDKSRGIYVKLPFEAHIRPAIMYLANWIYSSEKLQTGVKENLLIDKTADYLLERLYEDRDEAENAAREFIDFCKGRAWVFTDSGAKVYQFTHRTFLEYFTAFHMVRIHRTPQSLTAALMPRISRGEWDVVAQLAFQLQNEHTEDAINESLTILIKQSEMVGYLESFNLLYFAARCLQFIVPNPKVRKEIVFASLNRALSFNEQQVVDFNRHGFKAGVRIMLPLLTSMAENRDTIIKAIERILIDWVNESDETRACLAAELGLQFRTLIRPTTHDTSLEVLNMASDIEAHLISECLGRLKVLALAKFEIAYDCFVRGLIDLTDLVTQYGVSAIFRVRPYRLYPNMISVSIATLIIGKVILRSAFVGASLGINLSALQQLGSILSGSIMPFADERQIDTASISLSISPDQIKSIEKLNPLIDWEAKSLLGAFILVASLFEVDRELGFKMIRVVKELTDKIMPIFSARSKATILAETELNNLGFESEHQVLIQRWARGEIHFIRLGQESFISNARKSKAR